MKKYYSQRFLNFKISQKCHNQKKINLIDFGYRLELLKILKQIKKAKKKFHLLEQLLTNSFCKILQKNKIKK
ncbi:unnamed protein product [Paramecium sonneborni]|uniref:Uncharacterized protein n=1 Tax=Paramecium sonneborni TaxID=65129 RepID=A0A8S1KRL6_9CILI|nr:unnamed protein product [Paramecium sonneborni]